jgi:hypothetical protein
MKYLLISILGFLLFACEQVTDIKIKDGVEQLVVDAWLTDEADMQSIKLTLSQPYFDNSAAKPALGATVRVFKEDSTFYEFKDLKNNGEYTYIPKDKGYLKLNQRTALYIQYGGEEYYALSELKRVPSIDSIRFENFESPVAPPNGGPKVGFIGEYYAKDPEGKNDTYLIRSYKNDTLRFKPSEITLAYDGGFSQNGTSDGLQFILPIRQGINSTLYSDKDKVKVELFSIPVEAYYFLLQLRQESQNGGIFATPLANIPTNIINLNASSKKKAIGAFFVSRVSRMEAIVDKKTARPRKNF